MWFVLGLGVMGQGIIVHVGFRVCTGVIGFGARGTKESFGLKLESQRPFAAAALYLTGRRRIPSRPKNLHPKP